MENKNSSKTVVWLVLGVLAFFAFMAVTLTFSWYNAAVRLDNGVRAQWIDNQNTYDNFWKKVKETAQVPEQYKNAFKEVFVGGVAARYEGKDPALSFIQEQNPALDPSMYLQVQRVIEAGRNEFQTSQRSLSDRQRTYKNHLETGSGVLLADLFNFPREVNGLSKPPRDMDGDSRLTALDYPIVTSGATQEAFSSSQAAELDVFGKK